MFWSSKASPRRARLSLESLDGRIMPDATGTSPAPIAVFAQAAPAAPGTSDAAAPQITSFGAAEISTGWYLFTGTVTAAGNPAGIVVTLGGGPASLAGVTATVQADGTFSVLVQMQTNGNDDGTATAVFTQNGVQSNVAMTYVSPSQ